MNNLDLCICKLLRYYQRQLLSRQKIIKWNFDDVNHDYIQGQIDTYLKIIEDLQSLL